jgi:cytochrome c oxidase subunit II
VNDFKDFLGSLMRQLLFLPEQASTFAVRVDRLHYFVVSVTMISSTFVGLAAMYFFFRYRETKQHASTPVVTPSMRFEAMIIGVPLIFFLIWVWIGFKDYIWYTAPPRDATDVYVTGKKWMWHFAFPDGPNGNAVLTVPVHRPIRLLLTSRDVIHSFYVPEFRVKQDVIPGRYTEIWFEATKPGRYRIYCAEFCGTWHSQMVGWVVVLPAPEFDNWLAREREGLAGRVDGSGTDTADTFRGDLVSYGRRVAGAQGCLKCHSLDGEPHIGPTWVDLYHRKEVLANGDTIIADEAYLTDSMMDPYAKVVRGYAQVMPSYRGRLSAPEAAALVEFIKTLRSESLENVSAKEPLYGPIEQRR